MRFSRTASPRVQKVWNQRQSGARPILSAPDGTSSLQRTGQEIAHPDDIDAGIDLAEALLRGEPPGFTQEKRCLRWDGSPVREDPSVSRGNPRPTSGAGNFTHNLAQLWPSPLP